MLSLYNSNELLKNIDVSLTMPAKINNFAIGKFYRNIRRTINGTYNLIKL